uniref:helix-turn-helix domain-containing protein n=1 Tax=Streptomyces carminius TaxID=2665496 RepID=UPI0038CDB02C
MARRTDRESSGPGDIGRRLALQRERLGLTREETATRAGMAPGYLAYLEEHPASPSGPALLRLAAALETSVDWLRGGGTDLPPGRGPAAHHPRLVELGPEDCRTRLSSHGVGRIAVTTPDGPAIVPVNYLVSDTGIAFRTAPDATPAAAVGHEVAFEVDQVDEAMRRGWSVLVVGPARTASPKEAARLAELAPSEPWAGGDREQWVIVRPDRVTGRQIRTG